MANFIYIAVSLDGFIATSNGGLDWLNEIPNPEQSDFGFDEFMNKIDAIVMGRKTFEKVLTFNDWVYNKPVFVLSNTIKEIPENLKEKVEIINGEIHSIIKKLKEQGYNNLYIDGGKTIQSFLNENLIDNLILTHVSILLGNGIPLFGNLSNNIKYEHIKTEVLNKDLVKSTYKKI
jgi:dihydrofolate reductase